MCAAKVTSGEQLHYPRSHNVTEYIVFHANEMLLRRIEEIPESIANAEHLGIAVDAEEVEQIVRRNPRQGGKFVVMVRTFHCAKCAELYPEIFIGRPLDIEVLPNDGYIKATCPHSNHVYTINSNYYYRPGLFQSQPVLPATDPTTQPNFLARLGRLLTTLLPKLS